MFVTITKYLTGTKRGNELVFDSWFQGFSPLLAGTMYSGRTQVVEEALCFMKDWKQRSLIQEGARAWHIPKDSPDGQRSQFYFSRPPPNHHIVTPIKGFILIRSGPS